MIDEHKIEETAKVYLVLSDDGTKWEIDPMLSKSDNPDWPLDGYPDGACCDYRHDTPDEILECAGLRMSAPPLPTLSELHALIGEHL